MGLRDTQFLNNVHMDLLSLQPEAKKYSEIMNHLAIDLLPAQVTESSDKGTFKRIGFSSQDGNKRLGFLSDKIEFVNDSMVPTASVDQTYSQFVEEAETVIVKSMSYVKKNATRLVTKSTFFYDCQPNDYLPIAQRIFHLPPSFSNPEPEWTWRCLTHEDRSFGGLQELTNNLLNIRAFSGEVSEGIIDPKRTNFSGVQVSIEINTHQSNNEPRFSQDQTIAFFTESIGWVSSMKSEMVDFMGLSL